MQSEAEPWVSVGSDAPSINVIEEELTTLAGHLNAGNFRFLKLLAEFERREGYAGWGIISCAHWLSWRCGIGLVAARDKMRVARSLERLPLISEAMREGRLSYCKVRALTRVANAENEPMLLRLSQHATVSHVERIVRLYKSTSRDEQLSQSNERYAERSAQCYFDEQGWLIVKARLAPEQGASFMRALQLAGDTLRDAERSRPAADRSVATSATHGSPDNPVDVLRARQADALALLAETSLAHGITPTSPGDRHLVTVHVDARVLANASAEGRCELQDVVIPPDTVRRLCCDGGLNALVENEVGTPIAASRKTRVVPPAMRRALIDRDGGCRFPGCSNTRFTDAHHIIHWADGGETTLDNLTLLCRKHHRYLHEYGFRLERVANQLTFSKPNGQPIPDAPQPTACTSDEGCTALVEAHDTAGIIIGVETAVPSWNGERPQYAHIIECLHAREDHATREAAESLARLRAEHARSTRTEPS